MELDTKTESVDPRVLKRERTWTASDYVQERGKAAQTIEGARVAAFSQDLLEQIEQIWVEGAVAAGENYQAAEGTKTPPVRVVRDGIHCESLRTGLDLWM